MVNRLYQCDPDRLRSDLAGELSPGEQAELAGHLEHCGTCQKQLERLAAGSRIWAELPHLGGPADPSNNGLPPDERTSRPWGKPKPAVGREALAFLAPSENPAYLGRLGPYEVIGVLGEGGMGVVLKAFDPSLSRVVAIKVLAPHMAASGAARRRFSREAKAAAAVVHDHVIAIYAVDTDPESSLPYLVMPCIAGQSLQERIDRDGPLRIEEILRIGMQTALGLAAAHAQGLVHRDIKPSNILLENGVERVKITDFGLARAIDDASQSQSGVVAGTPQYMSPEQANGETVDRRADLFSLGSVLYAMCAGHSPFRAKTMMGVLRRVCDESPRPLFEINPEVPEALEAAIARLHAKDPAMRYQSASEVAEVLSRQLAELQRPGRRPTSRAIEAGIQPVVTAKPATKKAEAVDDLGSARARPRITKLAAAALLALLGLAVVGTSARFVSPGPPPARAGIAANLVGQPPDGQVRPPARVTVVSDDNREEIVGSGKPATKAFNLVDFKSVEIMHAFRAEITRADRYAVSVTADDNVLAHVQVANETGKLRVSLEDGRSYRLRRDSLKVAITMPALESLTLTHGARAAISGFESKQPFEARLRHGSLLEGTIGAGRVDFDLMHGSEVVLKGTALTAKLDAQHGSQFLLEGLAIRDAEIHLQHGSKATITARSETDLKAAIYHGSTLNGVIHQGKIGLVAAHGSHVTLSGSAQNATIAGEHSSRFSLGELALETAEVRLDHGSSATVNAKSQLKYNIGHASNLNYLGSPAVSGSVSPHGGSVRPVRAGGDRPTEGKARADEPARAVGKGQNPSEASSPSPRFRGDGHEIITINLGGGRFGSGPLIVGSGQRVTKVVDTKDFTAIRIERLIAADVTRAESFNVTLTADDNILERLEAVRDGSTLWIRLAEGNYRLPERPRVSITLPILEEIDVAGAASAAVKGFDSDRPFRARASGASILEGSIRAGDVNFEVSGASTVKLSGSAHGARLLASGASKLELTDWQMNGERLTIEVSGASSTRVGGKARAAVLKATGASRLNLPDLSLEAADVVLTGASQANVRVQSLLNYELSSASRLEYFGEPTIDKAEQERSSSVVHRR
ncbi:MAG TPA: DUF2807 domain-containing protein [Isosphaeraceae bacterium]|nr:DUF2807 domain-containing protein [Isosphaeraceae bacterium]